MAKSRKSMVNIKDEIDYYDHQIDGIRDMARRQSFILADEMGLGKSLQSLTVFAIALVLKETKRILIVCPGSLKGNWEEEIAERMRDIECVVLSNKSPASREFELDAFEKGTCPVLVVNYEQIIPHGPRLNKMGFGIVIADEAHALKNRNAERTKAFLMLNMPRKFLLTGSPLLNDVTELWSLLHIVAPYKFNNFFAFRNRYAALGGYGGKKVVGIKNEKELRQLLHFYMIRREKSDCLDLPEKQIIPVFLDMHPEQRKLYTAIKEDLHFANPEDPTDVTEVANGGVKFIYQNMVCGTTACFRGWPDYSSKLDHAVEMVKDIIAQNEPIVIFTQYRAVQRCMNERLIKAGIETLVMNGDTKVPDRIPMVKAWTADSVAGKHKAIICTYKVAGVGLNMTQASKCIALDQLPVPLLNEQAYDRLHRIGQKATVQVFVLIMRKSVQQRVMNILKMKKGLFGALVTNGKSSWRQLIIDAANAADEEED